MMKRTDFFLGEEQLKKLKKICESKGRKMAEILRELVEEYISKNEKTK